MAEKQYITAEGYREQLRLLHIRADHPFRLAVCRTRQRELEIPVYRTNLAQPDDLKHHPKNW